jgi:hypothetical protein
MEKENNSQKHKEFSIDTNQRFGEIKTYEDLYDFFSTYDFHFNRLFMLRGKEYNGKMHFFNWSQANLQDGKDTLGYHLANFWNEELKRIFSQFLKNQYEK